MHYPWWYVPHLTAPMLIALIAVVHVVVSHYAVGGGLFLAVETSFAHRTGDRDYLAYLRRHTGFFVLLTVVFGAITGVGIWWTIGLASPLATEVLVRGFVFGWATEYVFFLLEIVSAFAFLYYWDKLSPKIHSIIGWIYGLSAWISLVLITGITAFMLHPGAWIENQSFWSGFFNPQFLPQTIARTGGSLLIASLYVFLHASITIKDTRLHDLIAQRSTRPALLGAVLVVAGGAGWYFYLPDSAKGVLESSAVLTVFVGLIFALTIAVFALLYLGPYRNPRWMTPGFAGALLLFGVAAIATGEFIRESVRKPYILYNVVLGNEIFTDEVGKLQRSGYLEGGRWTREFIRDEYPDLIDDDGRIDESRLLDLPQNDRVALGEVLFQYHCNDCHAARRGYSAVGPLIRGRTPEMNLWTIEHLDEAHFFMPPWAGTPEEARVLAEYLQEITPPRPKGMAPETAVREKP
jgi:cytochrome bd ubiquinol oxidase subunit I